MKKYSTFDTSDFDDIEDGNSFSKEIIRVFLNELETLIPLLKNTLETKNVNTLHQAIHKVKPTIHILKIKHIFYEVDTINALTDFSWCENIETNTIKILEHLKVVEGEMKGV